MVSVTSTGIGPSAAIAADLLNVVLIPLYG